MDIGVPYPAFTFKRPLRRLSMGKHGKYSDSDQDSASNDDKDGILPGPPLPPSSASIADTGAVSTDVADSNSDSNRDPTSARISRKKRKRLNLENKKTRQGKNNKNPKIFDQEIKTLLTFMPSSKMYEKSYMHRDIVTHVNVAQMSDFLVSASLDGQIKLWKKLPVQSKDDNNNKNTSKDKSDTSGNTIAFVKQFIAHTGPISGLAISAEGEYMATCSAADDSIKLFALSSFDMLTFLKLDYSPSVCEWFQPSRRGPEYSESQHRNDDQALLVNSIVPQLAVADQKSSRIFLYKGIGDKSEMENGVLDNVHTFPVILIKFNPRYNVMVSVDSKGFIEYWNPITKKIGPQSSDLIQFSMKLETDLFEFVKTKTIPYSMEISSDGSKIAFYTSNHTISIFHFLSGKLYRKYDESLPSIQSLRDQGVKPLSDLEQVDFGRRCARERDYSASLPQGHDSDLVAKKKLHSIGALPNVIFDESAKFILYGTLAGIKVVHLESNKAVQYVGIAESAERFVNISLYQGTPALKKGSSVQYVASDLPDPLIIASSFERQRIYLLTKREPDENMTDNKDLVSRDIYNEKPMASLSLADRRPTLANQSVQNTTAKKVDEKGATLHTTMGDIVLKLYPKETPRTVENFVTLARRGYYNKVKFHRIIKKFMIQTGDPDGDGTGGESCWGGEFEDEIVASLKHNREGILSMANAGPNTNGSQFFITTVATPWLDGKHTIFGCVTKGLDVVKAIENCKTDKRDMPLQDIRIQSITLHGDD